MKRGFLYFLGELKNGPIVLTGSGRKEKIQIKDKEKPPGSQAAYFLNFLRGEIESGYSSIQELLYPRNVSKVCIVSKRNRKFLVNYISLFSYLFISYQMSAKPYFIGSTGIFTFCSRSHIGAYLLMFSLSNVVNFVVNTSMLSDALSLFWHSQ